MTKVTSIHAKKNMNCVLYQKSNPICRLTVDNNGIFQSIDEIYDKERLPIRLDSANLLESFCIWWKYYTIPVNRDSIRIGLEKLGNISPEELKYLGAGFNLANQYWVQTEDTQYTWEEYNLYENGFSNYIGDAIFNHTPYYSPNSLTLKQNFSPDTSLNGMLKKRWVTLNHTPFLLKGSSRYDQNVFNEVFATSLYEKLGVPHTPYDLVLYHGEIYCACPCQTNRHTEIISGAELFSRYSDMKVSYNGYCEIMKKLNVYGNNILDAMNYVDVLIANTDRHLGNIAVLHDIDIDVYEHMPIFDSGTSLFCDTSLDYIDFADFSNSYRSFTNSFVKDTEVLNYVSEMPYLTSFDYMECVEQYMKLITQYANMKPSRMLQLAKGVCVRYNALQVQIGLTSPTYQIEEIEIAHLIESVRQQIQTIPQIERNPSKFQFITNHSGCCQPHFSQDERQ